MKTAEELKQILHKIDHKGYGSYKVLKGDYKFNGWQLNIDYVQGDPFATPSRIRLIVDNKENFPTQLFENRWRKVALEDYLLRMLHKNLYQMEFKKKGSGKSGCITACRVGQEVLERIAVLIDKKQIEVRLEVGFPAYGRTIAAFELEKILFTLLPQIVNKTFYYRSLNHKAIEQVIHLADDQQAIRDQLKEKSLCAFIADGAILPRESGISQKPLLSAIPFYAPESTAVTLQLPHKGAMRGMGIRQGVTVIVGGGYHGKSTLLKAVESGVYNHIAGDGREYVITDDTAVKLRAEEGRCIHKVDISMFINHLPNQIDTTCFSTENASGSTSQAANTIEAIAEGSQLFLIDEDTSATNFMVRDQLMAQLVSDVQEPITPFVRCVRSLYEDMGISTVIVVGSSGAYLSVADTVIQMDNYKVKDVTVQAKQIAAADMEQHTTVQSSYLQNQIPKMAVNKMKVHGWDTLSLDRTEIDLRYFEQLTDAEQTAALGYCMQYILNRLADGRKNAIELTELLLEEINKYGFVHIISGSYLSGCPALPRKHEISACLQRYRKI